ncbi:MAG: nucleotidyltransferase domain-containing protein [Acidobacteria bacterium]|nr:nucleotidyltransferase domain-containing protein [Acidobacteriota bacterium]MCB9398621.1 nucleotidyltransferase domain-containing protein [Acidobacteriota bacterium]
MRPSVALNKHRLAIREIVALHQGQNVRVFGSALSGQDVEGSDLDLVIAVNERTTLFDLAAIQEKLGVLLGVPVDLVTENGLPILFRAQVLDEATPV